MFCRLQEEKEGSVLLFPQEFDIKHRVTLYGKKHACYNTMCLKSQQVGIHVVCCHEDIYWALLLGIYSSFTTLQAPRLGEVHRCELSFFFIFTKQFSFFLFSFYLFLLSLLSVLHSFVYFHISKSYKN